MLKKVSCLLLVVCVIILAGCGAPEGLINALNTTGAPETTAAPETTIYVAPDTEPETAAGTYAKEEGRVYADLDALNEIEENDDFAITIVDREIIRDAYTEPSAAFEGSDAIVFNVKNNTGEFINEIDFLLFPTNGFGEGVSVDLLSFSSNIYFGEMDSFSDKVQLLSTEDAEMEAGEDEKFAVQCDASRIVNMNAIVYSYIDSNGEEVINENVYEWLLNTQEGYLIETYSVD